MLGRIIITNTPRGIDGAAGFQIVQRTDSLHASVAKRLSMRSAYPHPFPFGDPRNPHVIFHRIETVGSQRLHILGSLRDTGRSYTGRSNHLAELIAIDQTGIQSLPSGPAFAAHSFPWMRQWSGDPHER